MAIVNIQTNYGLITLEINEQAAPITAKNFLDYCQSGFYNNTIFHRVIDRFMIQGGGFSPEMQQKSTNRPIQNEASNGLKNEIGSIAMARTSDPHSATAQFFINVANNDFLNFKSETPQGWGYCVFGKVVAGLEVVNKISHVKTTNRAGHQDVPELPVIIENVEVVANTLNEATLAQ
jgi:peptidyl-prolyl cis-trans isomerase B (cyclophilin B)